MAISTTLSLNNSSILFWRTLQALFFCLCALIFALLVFRPALGIHALWNFLIPVAPLLLVFAPGLWRNICPISSLSLFLERFKASPHSKLSNSLRGRFNLFGVLALLAFVPLRHVILDTNGPASALVLALIVLASIGVGFFFDYKSAWCAGLCPVHPVEKLYGQSAAVSTPNLHCGSCKLCVAPCPDSTPALHPLLEIKTFSQRWAGRIMVGGFPGFIWGWFMTPDFSGNEGWSHLGLIYGLPMLGLLASLGLFLLLRLVLKSEQQRMLTRVFAAASVAAYYWFRIPALFGFGPFPGDGMLLDLRGVLPFWFPALSNLLSTGLLFYALVLRTNKVSWSPRPAFEPGAAARARA